jgi:hypothetical protein
MNAASFQAEAVFNRHGFARRIVFVHSADLRNRGLRFIDDEQDQLRLISAAS